MDNILFDPLDINLDIDDLDELSDTDADNEMRSPKRYIRDTANPFDYNDKEFKRRFRFTKHAVLFGILPLIEKPLKKNNNRGLPISPVMQLLISLRFYATASFQDVCAEIFHVSQPTVCRIIFRVSVLLAALMKDYIKMPKSNSDTAKENRKLFQLLGGTARLPGLPGIDGAIDCTHVKLVYTVFQQFQEVYRNRKGFFSLNVQAVVGPRMEFLDIVPEWAGSEHDSRIFQNSRLCMKYEERVLTGALVGDSGYSCMTYLLTPVVNPRTEAQQRYNFVQAKTRNIVERTFGVWKRRFPCLSRGLANKLLCTTSIIVACAVLHNISLNIDGTLPEDEEELEMEEVPVDPPHNQPAAGLAARQVLIDRLYCNID